MTIAKNKNVNNELNYYSFVSNNPIEFIDILGLWKSWTHKKLTKIAWNSIRLDESINQYSKKIIELIKKENVNIDKGETFKMHGKFITHMQFI